MLHWRAALAALALAAAAMAPLAARAQNAIQSITSSQQAGTEVVRIELSEALAAVPNGFSVQAPPRIAIDLPGVGNAIGRNNGRDQPGQPAFGERGPGRRAHAAGAQPASRPRATAPRCRARRCWWCWTWPARPWPPPRPRRPAGALRAGAERRLAGAARDRLPPRHRWRRPRRRQPAQHAGRRRHPPAGPEPGGRVPALDAARRPAPAAGRHRLRHAGAHRRHLPERRPRAHGRRPQRRLGAQRLPERQPVRAGGAAGQGRPEQAHPGPRLPGREAEPEFPEHRSARAAAGDRRLHQLQRRHQRHRHRHRDAAPEGRALGPGAGHHPAEQGPGRAQERQRAVDRTQGRTRRQGTGRPRGAEEGDRARAAAHAVVPAQLRQGRGHHEADRGQPGAGRPAVGGHRAAATACCRRAARSTSTCAPTRCS